MVWGGHYVSGFQINNPHSVSYISILHGGYDSENIQASPQRAKQLFAVSSPMSPPSRERDAWKEKTLSEN